MLLGTFKRMNDYGVSGSSDMWSLSNCQSFVFIFFFFLEDWDELEKSIIANLADDVTVGINGDNVEMVITKKKRN